MSEVTAEKELDFHREKIYKIKELELRRLRKKH